MKFIHKIFGLLLLTAIVLTGCKKDVHQFVKDEITPPDYSKTVRTDIAGTVVDELGEPLKDVEISIGNEITLTDENGVYLFRDALVPERKAFVKAEKAGYFHGSRTMIVQGEKLHFADIQLLEKINVGTFESTAGGVITFQNVELVFPENGVKLKNGNDYSGNVNVEAKYLDPTDDHVNTKMPGDLRGINEKGEEIVMATFGMTAVELTGSGGEELQITDGAEVKMNMPLPASLLSLAPATIPLWYFDEEVGLWKEDGSAVLEGDKYVGSVTHFTWWNNDFPYEAVDVKGQVLDENGTPLAGVHVNIRVVGDAYGGHGTTNADGVFCGGMPKGYELELTIVGDGACFNWNQPLFTQNIGSFTENTTLPPITVTLGSGTAKQSFISGRLIDCDDNPVINGYVQGQFGSERFQFFTDPTDGTFEMSFIYCSSAPNLIIQGYDLNSFLQSDELFYAEADNIQTGDLKVCDNLEEYVTYNLDGNDFTIPGRGIYGSRDWTSVSARLDNDVHLEMAVQAGDMLGTFPLIDLGSGGPNQDSISWHVNEFTMKENITVEVTFTRYDSDPSGLIIGTFGGDFDDKNGVPHKLSGTFRSKRN